MKEMTRIFFLSPGRERHPSRPVHICAASQMQRPLRRPASRDRSAPNRNLTRPHRPRRLSHLPSANRQTAPSTVTIFSTSTLLQILTPRDSAKRASASGNRPRPTHRVPNALARLHMRNSAQDRRRGGRRRSDILREMVHHLGNARIGNMGSNDACDRTTRLHCQDITEDARLKRCAHIKHVAKTANRFPKKEAIADAMHSFGERHEAPITLGCSRGCRESGKLRRPSSRYSQRDQESNRRRRTSAIADQAARDRASPRDPGRPRGRSYQEHLAALKLSVPCRSGTPGFRALPPFPQASHCAPEEALSCPRAANTHAEAKPPSPPPTTPTRFIVCLSLIFLSEALP